MKLEQCQYPGSIEGNILEVCEYLYRNNRKISLKSLAKEVRIRYNYAPEMVKNAISELINQRIIAPKSYLYRNVVLENPTRETIFELINEKVALSMYDIKKKIQIGNNLLAWNLNILLKFQLIREVQIGARKLFCNSKTRDEKAILYYYSRKLKENDSLLEILLECPMRVREILQRTKIDRTTLNNIIRRFLEIGIMQAKKGQKYKIYMISPTYAKYIKTYQRDRAKYLKNKQTGLQKCKSKIKPNPKNHKQELLIESIKKLDDLFHSNQLSQEDYLELKSDYKAQLILLKNAEDIV